MIVLNLLLLAIAIIVGLVIGLLLALLLVPFRLESSLTAGREYKGTLDVRWFWGVLGLFVTIAPEKKRGSLTVFGGRLYTFPINESSAPRTKKKTTRKKEKKRKKRARRKNRRLTYGRSEQVWTLVQWVSLDSLREVLRLLSALFGSLRLRLSADAEIGLPDPADTGLLIGALAATGLQSALGPRLRPNWHKPTLAGRITLCARVWLAQIIAVAVRGALASSIRGIWWTYLKRRFSPFSPKRAHPGAE